MGVRADVTRNIQLISNEACSCSESHFKRQIWYYYLTVVTKSAKGKKEEISSKIEASPIKPDSKSSKRRKSVGGSILKSLKNDILEQELDEETDDLSFNKSIMN